MTELLPCPFCGNAPVTNRRGSNLLGQIYCKSDDCFGPRTTAQCYADSVVQWNARARPSGAETREASPTQVAAFLAGSLHNVLAHFDTLPLDEYFAAAGAGNKFALVLEKINAEASSALSVAAVHSIFNQPNEQADAG